MEPVSPARVAEEAGFSLFHFHRIFRGMVGQSLGNYLRRRRLTDAGEQLLTTDRRVLDIALDYQFGSQAAFTRAFRTVYEMTPGEYRRRGQRLLLLEKPRLTVERLQHLQSGLTLEPSIQFRPARQVVGLPYLGKNQHGELGAIARELIRRRAGIPHRLADDVILGVCAPLPGGLTDESTISYLTAVPVSIVDSRLPQGMVAQEIPAGLWAVFTHRGSVDRLDESYQHIWGSWLPRSGYIPAEAPDYEVYDSRYDPDSETSEIDICIPVIEVGLPDMAGEVTQ